MKNKKLVFIGILACIGIIIFFLIKSNYKKLNFGNNIGNKSIEEIEEYILNISSYKAKIEVTVTSNKNENKYLLTQEFLKPNIAKQVVEEPSNIKGVTTINDGNNLTVFNSNLNLTQIYENYEYLNNNCLWINSFIEDYSKSNEKNIKSENSEIIMETKVENDNKYIQYKKLYLDDKTYKPTKLLVQDVNKKTLVYILFKEIELDSLSKEDILSFKLEDISGI